MNSANSKMLFLKYVSFVRSSSLSNPLRESKIFFRKIFKIAQIYDEKKTLLILGRKYYYEMSFVCQSIVLTASPRKSEKIVFKMN